MRVLILTLLDISSDRMSDAGRVITNCENCGQLMITKRSNASLTCGRTTCKKERLYKANDDYKDFEYLITQIAVIHFEIEHAGNMVFTSVLILLSLSAAP